MKIYIGPYRNHINCYKWFDEKITPLIGEKYSEYIENITQSIINWCWNYPLNYLYYDRNIKIKLHNYDTWNMDTTLAHIITPMLKQLRQTKHGAPNVDDEDVPEELKSINAPPKTNEYATDGNYFRRWDWILDEMIWAFEQNTIDWEDQFHSGNIDLQYKEIPNSEFVELVSGPKDTHVFDKDGYNKHYERMKNGYRLFGKYYNSLWD